MIKTAASFFLLLCACAAGAQTASVAPDSTEAAIVQAVDASGAGDVAFLEKIVDINSGTMNLAGVVKVKDVLEPQIAALGFTTVWHPMDQVDGRAGDLVGGASVSDRQGEVREAHSADRAYGHGV